VKIFGQKMGFLKKWSIFFGFFAISFDPMNRFSQFKNQNAPNFTGFLLIYILGAKPKNKF